MFEREWYIYPELRLDEYGLYVLSRLDEFNHREKFAALRILYVKNHDEEDFLEFCGEFRRFLDTLLIQMATQNPLTSTPPADLVASPRDLLVKRASHGDLPDEVISNDLCGHEVIEENCLCLKELERFENPETMLETPDPESILDWQRESFDVETLEAPDFPSLADFTDLMLSFLDNVMVTKREVLEIYSRASGTDSELGLQ